MDRESFCTTCFCRDDKADRIDLMISFALSYVKVSFIEPPNDLYQLHMYDDLIRRTQRT